nr:immunoglobulin light chain junction region [Macaca mulatta]MOY10668.1 immunoglobulin light chain junction region [Macaca mulatta]MOY10682.1 immunoglobulin light chain junction region [Macaca mulatta]MOY10841.1 immunoglobulin light chain junction region [Macaca mulatta]MOY10965.1 immunoglobulin light chain junction region [Macaca mulatta]
CQHYSDWPYSF